jgi:UDP-N-acetylglucosamine 2-epimerase (non-hydrolysing)
MSKVLIIVGSRPEAIKLFPVYKALKACEGINTLLLTTGQHGGAMMNPLINFFEVQVDIQLNLTASNQSLNAFAGALMLALDEEFRKHKPDLIIVQGDTTSCTIGSLAAFYGGIKIAHVEAGLRTYNKHSPFPEEINRRITSLITDFHFVPTRNAQQNLERENVEGQIELVGNTVIDSLLEACDRIMKLEIRYQKKFEYIKAHYKEIILITGHRRENIGSNFREIYSAIVQLSSQHKDLAFVYPLHTNPAVKILATEMLTGITNVFLMEALPYDEMVFLMKESYLVMTDSGGIQEECPTLNKPVLVLRDTTERPEGIEAGCSILTGVTKERIVTIFNTLLGDKKIYNKMSSVKNPYGDGTSSIKIAEYLKSRISKS